MFSHTLEFSLTDMSRGKISMFFDLSTLTATLTCSLLALGWCLQHYYSNWSRYTGYWLHCLNKQIRFNHLQNGRPKSSDLNKARVCKWSLPHLFVCLHLQGHVMFCYAAKCMTYLQPAESTAELPDGPGWLYLKKITTALVNIVINDPTARYKTEPYRCQTLYTTHYTKLDKC